jgi:hypothetical protein
MTTGTDTTTPPPETPPAPPTPANDMEAALLNTYGSINTDFVAAVQAAACMWCFVGDPAKDGQHYVLRQRVHCTRTGG